MLNQVYNFSALCGQKSPLTSAFGPKRNKAWFTVPTVMRTCSFRSHNENLERMNKQRLLVTSLNLACWWGCEISLSFLPWCVTKTEVMNLAFCHAYALLLPYAFLCFLLPIYRISSSIPLSLLNYIHNFSWRFWGKLSPLILHLAIQLLCKALPYAATQSHLFVMSAITAQPLLNLLSNLSLSGIWHIHF